MGARYRLPETLAQMARSTDSRLFYLENTQHRTTLLHVYKRFVRLTKIINFNNMSMRNDYRVRKNYRQYLHNKFKSEDYPRKRAAVLGQGACGASSPAFGVVDANVIVNTYNFILKGIRCNFVRNNNDAEKGPATDDLVCKQIMKNILNMQFEKFKLYNYPASMYTAGKAEGRGGGGGGLPSPGFVSMNPKHSRNRMDIYTDSNISNKKLSADTIRKQLEVEKNILHEYTYLTPSTATATATTTTTTTTTTTKGERKITDKEMLKYINIAKFDRNIIYLNECLNTQL